MEARARVRGRVGEAVRGRVGEAVRVRVGVRVKSSQAGGGFA